MLDNAGVSHVRDVIGHVLLTEVILQVNSPILLKQLAEYTPSAVWCEKLSREQLAEYPPSTPWV